MLRLENLSCGYGPMTVVHELDLNPTRGEIFALLGGQRRRKIIHHHVRRRPRQSPPGPDFLPGRRNYRRAAGRQNKKRNCPGPGRTPPLFQSDRQGKSDRRGIRPIRSKNRGQYRKSFGHVPPAWPKDSTRGSGSLSGGEQQMLSIGRALMSEPELLLVDELSLGLMPKMIDICYQAVADLKKKRPDHRPGGTKHQPCPGSGRPDPGPGIGPGRLERIG